jgi:hypothetical protein
MLAMTQIVRPPTSVGWHVRTPGPKLIHAPALPQAVWVPSCRCCLGEHWPARSPCLDTKPHEIRIVLGRKLLNIFPTGVFLEFLLELHAQTKRLQLLVF